MSDAPSTDVHTVNSTKIFIYDDLREATNNFDPATLLGEGGFGRVYRGVLKDGTEVAIKKLSTGGHQGDREFLVEVEMLSRLHHRHLVKLVGYFSSRDTRTQLLCYELVPNGSLECWLHGTSFLPWFVPTNPLLCFKIDFLAIGRS
jgi:serine/threonine protein kinase